MSLDTGLGNATMCLRMISQAETSSIIVLCYLSFIGPLTAVVVRERKGEEEEKRQKNLSEIESRCAIHFRITPGVTDCHSSCQNWLFRILYVDQGLTKRSNRQRSIHLFIFPGRVVTSPTSTPTSRSCIVISFLEALAFLGVVHSERIVDVKAGEGQGLSGGGELILSSLPVLLEFEDYGAAPGSTLRHWETKGGGG